MPKFTDSITIKVRGGKGGAGCVSFFREKFIPKGGPDGGDGGKGGDVYVEANSNYSNLSHFFSDRIYRAKDGKPGSGQNRHGADGEDLILRVPLGTSVYEEDGTLIADLVENGQRAMVCRGGIGGRGNAFFKSSTNQSPRYAQPGMPGEEKNIVLNLKLIADIGLVGLPNVGKSTLLAAITNARPKIANYPFTTVVPNLGVLELKNGTACTIADIPGIVEGAHRGFGLGLSFLQHIERVRAILFLIEIIESDPVYNLKLLRSELAAYNPLLLKKPYYIVLTKLDAIHQSEARKRFDALKNERLIAVSAKSGENIDALVTIIEQLLEESSATA
ncbi:MAG: GTPase ObgE [Spirochaetes bacterium]|nr:GTPase ObgE [Spirochaetota bacterium]